MTTPNPDEAKSMSDEEFVKLQYPAAQFIGHSGGSMGRIAYWNGRELIDLTGWMSLDSDEEAPVWRAAAHGLRGYISVSTAPARAEGSVRRYAPLDYDEMPGEMVIARDYDAAIAERDSLRSAGEEMAKALEYISDRVEDSAEGIFHQKAVREAWSALYAWREATK